MKLKTLLLYAALLVFLALTMGPFAFVINSSFRDNIELYHSYFGVPRAFRGMGAAVLQLARGEARMMTIENSEGEARDVTPREALGHHARLAVLSYTRAWAVIRPYMINSWS